MLGGLVLCLSADRGRRVGSGGPSFSSICFAPRMWLRRTDANRPGKNLYVDFGKDSVLQAMFNASIVIELGDGNLSLFWSDHWLGHNSPCLIAPELCKLIKPRTRNTRTVDAALLDKRWIQDITGTLTVQALYEYLILWEAAEGVQLRQGVDVAHLGR